MVGKGVRTDGAVGRARGDILSCGVETAAQQFCLTASVSLQGLVHLIETYPVCAREAYNGRVEVTGSLNGADEGLLSLIVIGRYSNPGLRSWTGPRAFYEHARGRRRGWPLRHGCQEKRGVVRHFESDREDEQLSWHPYQTILCARSRTRTYTTSRIRPEPLCIRRSWFKSKRRPSSLNGHWPYLVNRPPSRSGSGVFCNSLSMKSAL